MTQKTCFSLLLLIALALLSACASQPASPTPAAGIANPASVYCEQNGGQLELRQDAAGGIAGVCVFPNGSECDEWAYFRGECQPAEATPTPAPTALPTDVPTAISAANPTDIPTARPIDPADYQGWWTYTHPVHGFSIQLPPDWVVDETAANDELLNGHLLMLHARRQSAGIEDASIRLTFRRAGENTLLWPTGVGAGQFIPQGTLEVAGQPARRVLFVCPGGQVNEIWYHGQAETDANIRRGDLEFGVIFTLTGFYCQEGHSLGGKLQYLGERVVASLRVP
jgi:putative hemolysin